MVRRARQEWQKARVRAGRVRRSASRPRRPTHFAQATAALRLRQHCPRCPASHELCWFGRLCRRAALTSAAPTSPAALLASYSAEWACPLDAEAFAARLDAQDPLRSVRGAFHVPPRAAIVATVSAEELDSAGISAGAEEAVYLCGNSLGLQPKATRTYIDEELAKWARLGVLGHFHGKRPWRDIDDVRVLLTSSTVLF